jgi:hypothetical protein
LQEERARFAHLAVALHEGEAKRIVETMVRGIDRTVYELVLDDRCQRRPHRSTGALLRALNLLTNLLLLGFGKPQLGQQLQ